MGVTPRVREVARDELLAQRTVRRLDLDDEPALEPRAQPLLEVRRGRAERRVAREHDLLPGLGQRVEDVEQLFLRALLAGDELHVVDEQRVGGAVARAPPLDRAVLERGDQLVDESLRADAGDASWRRRWPPAISFPIACSRCVLPDAARRRG